MHIYQTATDTELESYINGLKRFFNTKKLSAENYILLKEYLLGIRTDGYNKGESDQENGK